jgi:hypothetical protein
MPGDLASELAQIFNAGLASNPDLRQGLVKALTVVQSPQDDGGSETKAEANYRPQDDPDECCGHCCHFDGKGSCEIVAGRIAAQYVCDHYMASDMHDPSEPDTGKGSTSDYGNQTSVDPEADVVTPQQQQGGHG